MSPQTATQLQGFIGRSQWLALIEAGRGEGRQYFGAILADMGRRIVAMPVTYGQESMGGKAIVSLHYFMGGCDWYIMEKDIDPGVHGHVQAFGWANLNDIESAELGYISIPELLAHGAELDLHFTPCTLDELLAREAVKVPA